MASKVRGFMTKRIKKILFKRKMQRILRRVKKHAGVILLFILPFIALVIIHHLKKKAKKKIKKAVKAKIREDFDNRFHKDEPEE